MISYLETIAQCPQLKRRQQNVREIHNEVINVRKSYIHWLQTDAKIKNDNHLRLDSLCEYKLKLSILSTAAERSL